MATLSERLRVRSGPKPNYASDGSDSDPDDLLPQKDHTKEVGPLSDLESILDCEFRLIASDEPMANDGVPVGTSIRQYLVKWKNRSYMHCTWVTEQVFQKAYLSNPRLKYRVNKLHQQKDAAANRGEEFVAIPPEWTTVDRIIASWGKDDGKHYLVKFQGLPYDQCYWEASSNIPTFDKEIQRFEDTNCGSRREHESIQTEFHLFHQSPGFLTGSLHQYQLEGLNFLRFSRSQQRHVILADEMGLGKTIQSIAFLASLFEQNLSPYLVVAPLSTLRNWEREFATWAPHMNVVMYSGTSEARTVIRNHEFYFPKGQVSGQSKQDRIKFDVLLTSYEMINHDSKFLKPIRWSCMIVDEGHRLKNKESKLFGSLKLFTSDHRVLLTGTPLQNNLDELFVLMHFLDAGKFGSLEEFQEEYKDINQEEQISKLHNMLAPHVLRRVKTDVLKEMPPKTELILRVDLTSHQKELYKAVITGNYKILAGRGGAKVSNVLMELRKVCLHPYMVDGVEPPIQDQTEAFRLLLEYSGKLQIVDKMMVKLKEQGHRVLIYSQFQQMLDVLEDYCNYKNWYYERIDGKVGGAERQVRIDRFNAKNSNRFCFLLSTRAGGVGINLATADTVIIYDSDWNPHADLQAIARAHRLGQTNKVMIYRLVSRGTVEEKMLQMAKKKMLLEHIVVGKLKEEKLSQEELDDIIRYGAKEIFSENNEEAGKIHYDDEAIDKLLDRDRVEPEEVSKDDEEDSGFFKAFKVAHFECIDETEAVAAIEEGQGSGNKSPDRASYWEDLLKDRYEVHQAEELNALGKRKRSCKRVNFSEEDGQANLDLSSDESYETEPCDGKAELDDGEAELDDDEAVEQENQMDRARGTNRTRRRRRAEADGGEAAQQGGNQRRRARGPYITTRARGNAEAIPLLRYEGKNLWVLGFNKRERDTFYTTLMRFGVVDNDWSEFVHPLKQKTLAEIKNYGTLFLKHINEDTEDTPLKYSDIVPKESVNRVDILARIALLALVKKKLKFMEENPTSPLFPNRILYKYSQLRHVHVWKKEHDIILLRAIIKHGYGKWQNIVDDKDLGIQEVICKELSIPELPTYFRDRVKTFVRCRGLLLDKAIRDEHGDEHDGQIGSSSTHAEQVEPVTNSMDAIVPEETNHNRVFIDLTMEGKDEEAANE